MSKSITRELKWWILRTKDMSQQTNWSETPENSSDDEDEFDSGAVAKVWKEAFEELEHYWPPPELRRRWNKSPRPIDKIASIASMLYEKRLKTFARSSQSYSSYVLHCRRRWGIMKRSLRNMGFDGKEINDILGEKSFNTKYGAIEHRILRRFTRDDRAGIHFLDMGLGHSSENLAWLEEGIHLLGAGPSAEPSVWVPDHFFDNLKPELIALFGIKHMLYQNMRRMKQCLGFFPNENQGDTKYAFYYKTSLHRWVPDHELSNLTSMVCERLVPQCTEELRFLLRENNMGSFPRTGESSDLYLSMFFAASNASRADRDFGTIRYKERLESASNQMTNLLHSLFLMSDESFLRDMLKRLAVQTTSRKWTLNDTKRENAHTEPYAVLSNEKNMKPEKRERKYRCKVFRHVFGIQGDPKNELFKCFYKKWNQNLLP